MNAFNPPARQLSYLDLMLERSAPRPVDLFIHYVNIGVSKPRRRNFEEGLFTHLEGAISRCRTLHMNVPAESITPTRLRIFATPTPVLEELCLDFNIGMYSFAIASHPLAIYTPNVHYLPDCAKLENLVLRGTGYAHLIPHPNKPVLPALARLDIDRGAVIHPEAQWDLLRRSPNLISVRLGNMNSFLGSPLFIPDAPISLCHLQKLVLSPLPDPLLVGWAQNLDLPALRDLDVRAVWEYSVLERVFDSVDAESLTTFAFCVDEDIEPDDRFLPMFERLSGVRDLTMKIALDMPPLGVFVHLRDGTLWPQVDVLRLEHRYFPHDEDLEDNLRLRTEYDEVSQTLLHFVRSRNWAYCVRPGRARLERIVLRPYKLSAAVHAAIAYHVTVDEQIPAVDAKDSDSEQEYYSD